MDRDCSKSPRPGHQPTCQVQGDDDVRLLNPVAACAIQGVVFLLLLNTLFAMGAVPHTALVVAWLVSAPALLCVFVAAMPGGLRELLGRSA